MDRINSTNYFDKHIDNWTKFIKNKSYWDKEIETEDLEKQVRIIQTLRNTPTNI
ncbi:MAG: hypothetical protein H0X62_01660 [Bacteroidetes bacterium]|nr:hypothetical protein [Bacteroidota bacterium]